MSECAVPNTPGKDDGNRCRAASSLSLPAFHILSERDEIPPREAFTQIYARRRQRKVKSGGMNEEGTTSAEVHQAPAGLPRPCRAKRTPSRHERHKCHKTRRKAFENLQIANRTLLERINDLKRENFLLSKKLNASLTSLDSGLSQNEVLSPFEVDVNSAYQHVKSENGRLSNEIQVCRARCCELETELDRLERENMDLEGDVAMLKNLVLRLNVELERYQNGREGGRGARAGEAKSEILPRNCNKNFLKPVLPLLRAYSEALLEKTDMIESFEAEIKKFGTAFNDVLRENEKLYNELEKKMVSVEGDAANEVKTLRKDLEMAKQENGLLMSQIQLEQEKLSEVHSVYRIKVDPETQDRPEQVARVSDDPRLAEVLKQNELVNENLQENKADLYVMRGKYSILKQEFERLKLDNDSRVPMAVHSASIAECKRLFQDLKDEYETQKHRHLTTISEQEQAMTKMKKEWEECIRERSRLERFGAENDALRQKLSRMESRIPEGSKEKELASTRKELRESNARAEELSNKLVSTKKQLQKAMAFAEDIVKEQESLLMQLHAKQKENSYMATQFGSLKKQLKSVERGAQEGLNSVEAKMKSLESENSKLLSDVKRMRGVLREKEDLILRLEREGPPKG